MGAVKGVPACLLLLVAALAAAGCASRKFVAYKDGTSFHVTDDSARLKQRLCETGDIGRILGDSGLPGTMQAELRDCLCGPGKGRRRLEGVLNGMTDAQFAALKDAFRKNGYEINKVADS